MKSKNNTKITVLVIILCLLLGGGAYYYFVYRKKNLPIIYPSGGAAGGGTSGGGGTTSNEEATVRVKSSFWAAGDNVYATSPDVLAFPYYDEKIWLGSTNGVKSQQFYSNWDFIIFAGRMLGESTGYLIKRSGMIYVEFIPISSTLHEHSPTWAINCHECKNFANNSNCT